MIHTNDRKVIDEPVNFPAVTNYKQCTCSHSIDSDALYRVRDSSCSHTFLINVFKKSWFLVSCTLYLYLRYADAISKIFNDFKLNSNCKKSSRSQICRKWTQQKLAWADWLFCGMKKCHKLWFIQPDLWRWNIYSDLRQRL